MHHKIGFEIYMASSAAKRGVNRYHDHFFNVCLKVEDAEAQAKLNALVDTIVEKDFSRIRTEKQKKAVALFLLNAIYYEYGNLIMFLTNGSYIATSRYNASKLGSTVIIDIYRKLRKLKLFDVVYSGEAKSYSFKSTVIKCAYYLKRLCKQHHDVILKHIIDASEYVELYQTYWERRKGSTTSTKKRKRLEYLDDEFSVNASAFIKNYNIWLRGAEINCTPPRHVQKQWEQEEPETEERWFRSGRCVDLFRIFSFPSEWKYTESKPLHKFGGRYYRAFWIELPSVVRKYITINGVETVEIDFKAMNPTLMYFMATGKPWAEYPYENVPLPNNPAVFFPKPIMKCFFTWCINRPTRAKAIKTLERKLPVQEKLFLKQHGLTAADIVDSALQKHPDIASCFFQKPPLGRELQFYDSEIMTHIMSECKIRNIVCLPVHDGCIVQKPHMETVKEIMVKQLTACFNTQYYPDYKERLVDLEHEPEIDEDIEDNT